VQRIECGILCACAAHAEIPHWHAMWMTHTILTDEGRQAPKKVPGILLGTLLWQLHADDIHNGLLAILELVDRDRRVFKVTVLIERNFPNHAVVLGNRHGCENPGPVG
jgi:hypothetical protein